MKKSQIATYVNIFVILAVAAWCAAAFIPPKPHLQDTKAPNPNAFDELETADKLLVDDPAILPARKMPHVGEQGYMTSYLQGVSAAHQDKIIEANAAALQGMRIALTHEYLSPRCTSLEQLTPYYARYRQMGRLLSFEGKVAASRGDWQTAMENSLDSIALSYQIERGGPTTGPLVRCAISAIGRANAWYTVGHLDSRVARYSAERLQVLQTAEAPPSQLWAYEESGGEVMLAEIMEHPERADDSLKSPFIKLYFVLVPKWKIMNDYKTTMKDLEDKSSLPYQLTKSYGFPHDKTDLYMTVLLPGFRKDIFKQTLDQTYTKLLITMLALRAYELDHATAYPDRLDQLVPNYLSKVPTDPFASDLGALKYRRVGKSYLLYSVGPDGVDNGGKPFIGADYTGRPERNYPVAETKGDIVAGVNMD